MKWYEIIWNRLWSRKCPHKLMDYYTWKIDKIPKWVRRLYPTIHYCGEFDGLVIDKYVIEWDYCSCFPREYYK